MLSSQTVHFRVMFPRFSRFMKSSVLKMFLFAHIRQYQAQAKLLDQLAASLRDLERAEQEASRLIRNHIAENSANTILKSIIDARKAISFFSELHLGEKITPVVSEVDFLTGEALSYNENLHRTDGTKLREGTPVYALSMGVSADKRVVVRALVESVKTYTERTEKA